RELIDIWRKLGQTIIMVTHDLDEAITLSDRVVVLSGPPSRVLLDERITIPHPRDVFTLRETPQFTAHVQSLWAVLGQEFRAAASAAALCPHPRHLPCKTRSARTAAPACAGG